MLWITKEKSLSGPTEKQNFEIVNFKVILSKIVALAVSIIKRMWSKQK